MDSGIILRVMKSQAAHMSWKSWKDGTPKGVLLRAEGVADEGAGRRGNENGGRSRSQRE